MSAAYLVKDGDRNFLHYFGCNTSHAIDTNLV